MMTSRYEWNVHSFTHLFSSYVNIFIFLCHCSNFIYFLVKRMYRIFPVHTHTYQLHQQTFYPHLKVRKSAEVSDLRRTFLMNMTTFKIDRYTANISNLKIVRSVSNFYVFNYIRAFYCILFSVFGCLYHCRADLC